MTCNHLPSVTCDGCQHMRPSPQGIYIATTGGTSPGATMQHPRMDATVPCGTPMAKLDYLVDQLQKDAAKRSSERGSTMRIDQRVADAFRDSARALGFDRPTEFLEALLVHYLETKAAGGENK